MRFLLLGGFLSGVGWSAFPLFFDDGWAIPEGKGGYALAVLSAAITGVAIAFLSYPIAKKQGIVVNALAAVVSLPVAIAFFSILLHLTRLSLGVEFSPPAEQGAFLLILQSYLIYGFFGGGIVLIPLASLNHLALKWMCQQAGGHNFGGYAPSA